jgi:hypothetical protein
MQTKPKQFWQNEPNYHEIFQMLEKFDCSNPASRPSRKLAQIAATSGFTLGGSAERNRWPDPPREKRGWPRRRMGISSSISTMSVVRSKNEISRPSRGQLDFVRDYWQDTGAKR